MKVTGGGNQERQKRVQVGGGTVVVQQKDVKISEWSCLLAHCVLKTGSEGTSQGTIYCEDVCFNTGYAKENR